MKLLAFLALSLVACSGGSSNAPNGDIAAGATLFKQRCALCHQTSTQNGQGPGLAGVVGRKAGSGVFKYTAALRDSGLLLDPPGLDAFLSSPMSRVPGTTMVVAVPNADERRNLIAYLATLQAPTSPAGQPPGTVAGTAPAGQAPTEPAASESGAALPTVPPAGPSGAAPATVPPGGQSGAAPANAPLAGQAAATTATGQPNAAATASAKTETGLIRDDFPGRTHTVRFENLPAPYDSLSAGNPPSTTSRNGRVPKAPDGFVVELVTDKLRQPRAMRTAPNGDIFVAETSAGRISVIRDADGTPSLSVFADSLKGPFGIAFIPGYVYVATNNAVVRYAYTDGDRAAAAKPETIVASLSSTQGGHTTRDIVFAPDNKRFYVSVGSASNVADGMAKKSVSAAADWDKAHALGATWDSEDRRADVLWFSADGKQSGIYATGIRNCVGLAIRNGTLWCSTNERDGLGDDLVPDYVTRVREGGFYGWPWYYLGAHEDPRRKDERPDLKDKVVTPDVLLQAHSASLQMTFYDGQSFPADYRGHAFSALHGSWNRGHRTGYKVIRIPVDASGTPTGSYEDFVTGFALAEDDVWGRPVGLAVTKGGALLIAEDAANTIWRVKPR